ncbi:MAG: ATP-binding protein [Bacteroidales bacterium]|jgi:signal transduction histidine kinase
MGKLSILLVIILAGLISVQCNKSKIIKENSYHEGAQIQLDSIKLMDSLSFVTNLNDNSLSQTYANRAMRIAFSLNTPEGYILAWSAKANAFSSHSPDSEFIYLTKALDLSNRANILTHKPNLLANIARLYYSAYNSQKAMVLLDSSIFLGEKLNNYIVISNAYNQLGNIHYNAMSNELAKRFYDSAFLIAQRHLLFQQAGLALGNLAKMENLPEKRREMSKKAVYYLQKNGNPQDGLADVLINIGYTFTNPDSAIFNYKAALKIIHEANLPIEEMTAYNNLAYSYLDKGLKYEAKSCLIDHAIPLAVATDNLDMLSTLYDSYVDILSAQGNFKQAVVYEKKSIEIGNRANKQAAAGQVRLLSCMLDLKNKESLIQSKDKEILRHKSNERVFKLWLTVAFLGTITLIVLFFINNLRNKLKFQKQKVKSSRRIIEIEESEKRKLSMDLHDLSGQVKFELFERFNRINIPEGQERNDMMTKITELSDHIRMISHRLSSITIKEFRIEILLEGLCSEFRKFTGLDIQLVQEKEIPELSNETKLHIFRILQEILTNASKYAKNSRIRIEISISQNNFELLYSDNGAGFDTKTIKDKGLGLINIYERANLIGGKAELESSPGFGVYWKINVPLIFNNLAQHSL